MLSVYIIPTLLENASQITLNISSLYCYVLFIVLYIFNCYVDLFPLFFYYTHLHIYTFTIGYVYLRIPGYTNNCRQNITFFKWQSINNNQENRLTQYWQFHKHYYTCVYFIYTQKYKGRKNKVDWQTKKWLALVSIAK